LWFDFRKQFSTANLHQQNKMIPLKKIWFCGMVGACLPAMAEPVASETSAHPPPSASPSQFPATSQMAPYSDSAVASRPDSSTELTEGSLFQWGPVNFRPHLLYRFLYGNGIQQSTKPEKTAINEISPSLLFEIGTHWTLDYTPTLSLYSNPAFRDTLNHNVNLRGNAAYNDWVFGLSQNYNKSSDPLIETGTQTDQETFLTDLDASYHFSGELWTELGINQIFRSAENFTDSREWSTMDWLNYQFFPGYFAGIGAGFGYVDMETGSDMTYEQLQAQLGFRATEKISLRLSGGAESRQFLDSNANDAINPLFGASVEYRIFKVTTLSLSANRGVGTSYFQDQVTETTDVQFRLKQRLLEKLILDAGYGYSKTRYVSSANGLSSNRKDENNFFDVRVSCPIRKRANVAVFYHYSDNSSSQSAFAYSSSQVGLELGYRF
jgi:hypothetical protein